jgi:hypothetical protein
MKPFFDSLETFEQIQQIMKESSSEDGENLSFELKGTNGKTEIGRDFKDILAKEICAFANSYGGILCLHFGEKTNVIKFGSESIAEVYQILESWLRDSLEPRLLGINLKIADGIILINVPESLNKPHRTSTKTKTYYYRHVTQSEPMPEIMISSMYRSQDYLLTDSFISIHKTNNQLSFTIKLLNLSNISGSKPKIQLQIYTEGIDNELINLKWQNHLYIDIRGLDSFTPINDKESKQKGLYSEDFKLKIPLIGIINSNGEFANQVLYPLDSLHLSNYSEPIENLSNLKYLIVHLDYYFLESTKVSKTILFELADNKSISKMDSDKYTNKEIVNEYDKLKNERTPNI